MSTELMAKKPATVLRGLTVLPRDVAAALRRAEDVYVAGIQRLGAEYIDRVKKISASVTGANGEPAQ
jgi:hypothetical protein